MTGVDPPLLLYFAIAGDDAVLDVMQDIKEVGASFNADLGSPCPDVSGDLPLEAFKKRSGVALLVHHPECSGVDLFFVVCHSLSPVL